MFSTTDDLKVGLSYAAEDGLTDRSKCVGFYRSFQRALMWRVVSHSKGFIGFSSVKGPISKLILICIAYSTHLHMSAAGLSDYYIFTFAGLSCRLSFSFTPGISNSLAF